MTRSEPAWHPSGAKPAGAWNPAVGSVHDAPPVPRVVVIGSGFGGLTATKALAKAPVTVTLLSRTAHHLFQPLLYQVATGILSEGEIAPPTRDILKHQRNVEVLLGEVTDIDLADRTVTARTGELTTVTPYDYLIVATGADQSYFGPPEFAADAPGLKSIEDALDIRARLFNAFEMAEAGAGPPAPPGVADLRDRRRRRDRGRDGRSDLRAVATHAEQQFPPDRPGERADHPRRRRARRARGVRRSPVGEGVRETRPARCRT